MQPKSHIVREREVPPRRRPNRDDPDRVVKVDGLTKVPSLGAKSTDSELEAPILEYTGTFCSCQTNTTWASRTQPLRPKTTPDFLVKN